VRALKESPVAQFYEMPAVSPTMEFGTLVAWRTAEGQAFASGAIIAEVGTDKANMDAEIFDAGVLIKHLVAEGDEIPPGFPIAIWGKAKDEDVSALLADFAKRPRKATGQAPAAAAAPPAAAAPAAAAPAAPAPAAAAPAPAAPAAPAATTSTERTWMGRQIGRLFYDPPGDLRFGVVAGKVSATPLARKLAAAQGLDLSRVRGTGPGGRVTSEDLAAAPPPTTPSPTSAAARPDEVVRNSPMRKTIARRLLESHQQIPTFFLTVSFDAQGFVDLREDLKSKLPDLKASYNDLLILAVARSLREHPEVNASWGEQGITRHGRVDIGVAVALPDGLITPVLRDADHKGLRQVATEVKELATRAKAQKLQPAEYTGSTFTISNLGMMGIEHFTAIINPPEAAILAVGALERVVTASDDADGTSFQAAWRMRVTMTCDHRVIDGALGATFLQTLRRYVESPWLLLV
jgi:pyruvate dehydrogenase E2 component (dihydrolipoamide acetyltransferase)